MEPAVTFTAANHFTLGELTPLWNRAYEGYSVPLAFDVAQLAWHVTRSDIELSKSVVGFVDGEPFGLSLAGIRGGRAWIGGFGVAIEHRRQGLATRLMAEHLDRLAEAGIAETWLEVIDVNPAREVYRRSGFAETRELLVLGGTPAPGAGLVEIGPAELAEAHARLHPSPPAWRRQIETLLHDVEAGADPLAIRRGGAIVAFAVTQPYGAGLGLNDAAALDADAGRALFAALAARSPGIPLRLIDEPAATPLAAAAEAAGLTVGLRQAEMRRPMA